jgi:hypothetical protein
MKPGRPARVDYEYERNGTANLFMMFAPLRRRAPYCLSAACKASDPMETLTPARASTRSCRPTALEAVPESLRRHSHDQVIGLARHHLVDRAKVYIGQVL